MRDAVTITEDEVDLVSSEELKHEMSAEKGLAWFDKGDGKLRKGRALWFDSDLPMTWEGREFLTKFESIEADEVGLAEWVDEHILTTERQESERYLMSGRSEDRDALHERQDRQKSFSTTKDSAPSEEPGKEKEASGPFRFDLMRKISQKAKTRIAIVNVAKEQTKKRKEKRAGLSFASDKKDSNKENEKKLNLKDKDQNKVEK